MMTPIAAMQVDCGETSLELRRKELQLQYAAKLHASTENPTRSIIEVGQQNFRKHPPEKEPFAIKTNNLDQIICHAEIAKNNNHTDYPPWKLTALKIDSSLSEKVNKTRNNVAERKRITEITEMKINEYSRSMQIFTDASKKDDGRAGISFQIPSKNVDVQRRLSNNISIVSAEACAILEALKYIDGEGDCREVTIFSDSLEVVNTLEANTSKKSTHVIKEIRSIAYHMQQTGSIGVNIVWIPGHAGIRGNEQAHDAANTATEKNDIDIQQSITYDEANTLIKRHINQLWQNQWSESEKGGDYRIIEPRTSRNIKLTCRNRKREVIMTRLRFGKSQLNYYMHIMRMHKDGTCDECNTPETIEHFILNCTKNKLLTDELREICRGKNIQMTLGAILTDNVTLNTITDYIIDKQTKNMTDIIGSTLKHKL